jgi:hypothetical protein
MSEMEAPKTEAEPVKTQAQKNWKKATIAVRFANTLEFHSQHISKVAVTLLSAFPVFLVVFFFSGVGYGLKIHGSREQDATTTYALFGSGFGVLVALYLLDAPRWKRQRFRNIVKHVAFFSAIMSWTVGFVLCSSTFPSAHIVLCMIGLPSYFVCMKELRYFRVDMSLYLKTVAMSLLVCSFVVLCVWGVWVASLGPFLPLKQHRWNSALRSEYTERLCALDATLAPDELQPTCLAAYLVYFYPVLVSVGCFVFGGVAELLSLSLREKHDPSKMKLELTVRLTMTVFMLGVFGVWIAVGIAAAGVKLSTTVSLISMVLLSEMSVIVVTVVGWRKIKAQVLAIPLLRKMAQSSESDWVRGLIVITGALPFVAYLLLSFVRHQCFLRLCGLVPWLTGRAIEVDQARSAWPRSTRRFMHAVRRWNWTSVFTKICYLCLFFFICVIGVGKLCNVFFSWLNVQLSSMPFGPMCGLFIGFGVSLFLLPPVPGVPVYIIGGITVVKNGEEACGGFLPSLLACIAICLGIKLLAVVVQQKGFGENLGQLTSVRAIVGVNDVTIKAVRLILERPGLSLAKVCILCGGPDWPTSVLTGILGLKLHEMLLGTLPILFLIIPCVLTGVALVKAGEGGVWATLSPITLGVATISQAISMVSAAYFVEKVAAEEQDALDAIPDDPQVAALNAANRDKAMAYLAVTDWHGTLRPMPRCRRMTIAGAALLLVMACYLVQLLDGTCFVEFDITDTIDDPLPDGLSGSCLNLVKPLGWAAISMFVAGSLLLRWFGGWAAGEVARLEANENSIRDYQQEYAEGSSEYDQRYVDAGSDEAGDEAGDTDTSANAGGGAGGSGGGKGRGQGRLSAVDVLTEPEEGKWEEDGHGGWEHEEGKEEGGGGELKVDEGTKVMV